MRLMPIKNLPGYFVEIPEEEAKPYHTFYLNKARQLVRQNVLRKKEVCQFPYRIVPPAEQL